MIADLLFALTLSYPATPQVGKTCFNAPFALGVDNVPVETSVSTSVVNVWGFLDSNSTPVAWLFKNHLGAYYAEFERHAHPSAYLPKSLSRLSQRARSDDYFALVHLSVPEVLELENALLAHNVIRIGCFKSDYRLP